MMKMGEIEKIKKKILWNIFPLFWITFLYALHACMQCFYCTAESLSLSLSADLTVHCSDLVQHGMTYS